MNKSTKNIIRTLLAFSLIGCVKTYAACSVPQNDRYIYDMGIVTNKPSGIIYLPNPIKAWNYGSDCEAIYTSSFSSKLVGSYVKIPISGWGYYMVAGMIFNYDNGPGRSVLFHENVTLPTRYTRFSVNNLNNMMGYTYNDGLVDNNLPNSGAFNMELGTVKTSRGNVVTFFLKGTINVQSCEVQDNGSVSLGDHYSSELDNMTPVPVGISVRCIGSQNIDVKLDGDKTVDGLLKLAGNAKGAAIKITRNGNQVYLGNTFTTSVPVNTWSDLGFNAEYVKDNSQPAFSGGSANATMTYTITYP